VPSETKPPPGATAPMPTALAALSPPPPATTTLPWMPQRAHSSFFSSPEGWLPSTSRGMCARVRCVPASIGSDQSRRATSSQSVPAASDISETFSPVSRRRR